jgi:methylenetetrahydrofolate reductase (NADPH)
MIATEWSGPERRALPRRGSTPTSIKVSFEFFPPKNEAMETQLRAAVVRLAPLKPAFVSVTYGAGGSTRERTHSTVNWIQTETGLAAAAHLTCVNATRAEVNDVARQYWQAGIRHLVALRGDPPGSMGGAYTPGPDGYANAEELVIGLRDVAPFEISIAAYPEGHPEAISLEVDLDYLKRKIDAGAHRAISQFFFDNEAFYRFRDRAAAAGITVPIIPGILPVTNFAKTMQIATSCKAAVPDWFAEQFDGLDNDPETRQAVAAAVAEEQCRELIGHGVREFHFYTLNRAELTLAICHMLGIRGK